MNDLLLSSQEAARRLRVSASTVKRYAREGKLPHTKLPGGHFRFSPEDVDALLRSPSVDPQDGGVRPGPASLEAHAARPAYEGEDGRPSDVNVTGAAVVSGGKGRGAGRRNGTTYHQED